MKKHESYLVVGELLGFKPYRKHHLKYPSTERELLGIDPLPKHSNKVILLNDAPQENTQLSHHRPKL